MFFPGTYMKAFFEHIVCRVLGIKVYSAQKYISKTALSGHVSVVSDDSASKSFFFCFLPGLLSFIVGAPSVLVGCVTLGYLGIDVIDPLTGAFSPMFIVYCLVFLFGASFFTSMFPYHEDAVHMWNVIYGKANHTHPIWKLIAFVPSCIIVAGAFLERYCITFLMYVAVLVMWILT